MVFDRQHQRRAIAEDNAGIVAWVTRGRRYHPLTGLGEEIEAQQLEQGSRSRSSISTFYIVDLPGNPCGVSRRKIDNRISKEEQLVGRVRIFARPERLDWIAVIQREPLDAEARRDGVEARVQLGSVGFRQCVQSVRQVV